MNQAEVDPLLGTVWLGRAWRFLPECGSTNDEAAAWARAGAPHGAVVVAEAQTRGRGRLGRSWVSPPGESLYLSLVLRLPIAPQRVAPVTLAAGVALAETVARFGVTPRLKWPNDLLLDGRKLAGILTEMATAGTVVEHLVVGIGVNLNARTLPEEVAHIATSVARQRGTPVDRAVFAATLCERLETWIDRFVADGPAAVVAGWRGFAGGFGARVTVSAVGEPLSGVAVDLAEDGALLLRDDAGRVHRVIAGELAPA